MATLNSSPRPSSRRAASLTPHRRGLAVLIATCALVSVSACGISQVNEFGDDAKENFMKECLTDTEVVVGEEPIVTPLGTEAYCECVYVEMQDRFGLTFDELKSYEDDLAAVDDGGAVPTPPEDFTKAIDFCNTSGPVPESTETTEAS